MTHLHNISRPSDSKPQEPTSDDENFTQKQFKFVILGDGAVGKTSICHRFVEDHFANSYKQTIGLDFFVKRLTMNNPKGGKVQIALQLWDIGGQSVSSKMITKYIHGAHAVLLVYDITNYQTFENVMDWLGIVKQNIEKKEDMPYTALVGNKYVKFQFLSSCRKFPDVLLYIFCLYLGPATFENGEGEETQRIM